MISECKLQAWSQHSRYLETDVKISTTRMVEFWEGRLKVGQYQRGQSVSVGTLSMTVVLLLISWLTSVAYSVPGRRRGIGYRWWDGGGVGMSRAYCGDNYTGMK